MAAIRLEGFEPSAVARYAGLLSSAGNNPRPRTISIACPGMTLATGLVERHQKAHYKLQSL